MTTFQGTEYGDTPYIVRGMETDAKRIFKSKFDLALRNDITMVPGYGIIPQGTVIAAVLDGTRKNSYVPYVPQQPPASGGGYEPLGAAFLLQDGAADTNVYVTIEDSYKFAVGDVLVCADRTNYAGEGAGATDLGAVTAIDRESYPNKALITVTNNVTTAHTVALMSWVYIKTGATTPFVTAKGILQGGVDTGTGPNAKGGLGNIILSNCLLYTDMLLNLTSEAKTDIGAASHGKYTLLK
jgi:hypothetical protein